MDLLCCIGCGNPVDRKIAPLWTRKMEIEGRTFSTVICRQCLQVWEAGFNGEKGVEKLHLACAIEKVSVKSWSHEIARKHILILWDEYFGEEFNSRSILDTAKGLLADDLWGLLIEIEDLWEDRENLDETPCPSGC